MGRLEVAMFRTLMSDGGAVLWIILSCGVAALVVFVERALHLHKARIKSEDFLRLST